MENDTTSVEITAPAQVAKKRIFKKKSIIKRTPKVIDIEPEAKEDSVESTANDSFKNEPVSASDTTSDAPLMDTQSSSSEEASLNKKTTRSKKVNQTTEEPSTEKTPTASTDATIDAVTDAPATEETPKKRRGRPRLSDKPTKTTKKHDSEQVLEQSLDENQLTLFQELASEKTSDTQTLTQTNAQTNTQDKAQTSVATTPESKPEPKYHNRKNNKNQNNNLGSQTSTNTQAAQPTQPTQPTSTQATPTQTATQATQPTQAASTQTAQTAQNFTQINNKNKNKNRNFDGKNNGKQGNNQKKTVCMEDVAISEEEYKSDLTHRIMVNDLSVTPFEELKEKLAAISGNNIDDYAEYKKQEVIAELIRTFSRNGGVLYASGTLELMPDGYGFLRSPLNSYLSGPEDVYLAPQIIKFLNLKTGDTIEGSIRNPKDSERFLAIAKVATVNGDPPIVAKTRTNFDSLIPLYPDKRINLEVERTDDDVSMRIINLFCPIGKGQRALITAPPRTGKTILLQQIANSITTNHPEIKLMVLLVDERPEEVTDMRSNVRGEVIASTFDEQATRHVTVAEMVIEKAKRLVEHGKDVVILLDSITRLARAYNQTVPASGKILSGGVDSNALHKPKRFFGAARNIENGGSLTIIASALIETGSRMDEVIFEEFKGTGNSEIVLDRRMSDRRLYPAINIKKSGTRREDLILEKDEAARIWILRKAINAMEDVEITEFLIDKMRKTKNNEAFLRSMNTGTVPTF